MQFGDRSMTFASPTAIKITDNDIWLTTNSISNNEYRMRIGCGGVLSNLRNDRDEELLSPGFKDEKTDRVIQWTLWSSSLTNKLPALPDYEYRFNVTQGGDFQGNFSPIQAVEIDNRHNIVDIYATPIDNWKSEQQKFFGGGCSTLTRYHIMDNGIINVTRILKPLDIKYKGQTANLGKTYIEAWTPLNNRQFDNVALSFAWGPPDSDLMPLWWYNLDNLPTYPNFSIDSTNGYLMAFNNDRLASSDSIALVFGRKSLRTITGDHNYKQEDSDSISINTMTWDTGFGLLPGVNVENFTKDSILVTNYSLIFNKGVTPEFLELVREEVDKLPSPTHYTQKSQLPEDLIIIADNLERIPHIPSKRIDHLASFAKDDNSPNIRSNLSVEEPSEDWPIHSPLGQLEYYCHHGWQRIHTMAKTYFS